VRSLSASRLLDVWEAGQALGTPARAVAVLAAALPDRSPAELAALPLGDCDAALLAFHEHSFGPIAEGLATCPGCGDSVEVTLDLRQLHADAVDAGPGPWELRWDELTLVFRLPCPADLALAERAGDPASARRQIARRCVLAVLREQDTVSFDALPEAALAALAARMAELDPQADLELELRCPACDRTWDAILDIAGFVWARLAAAARRLAGDVALLARAYGWREADILGMSAWRRQLYLEWSGL
jgi:hypothetical protein